jgi:hypothetical protein
MPFGGLVVNRVHPAVDPAPPEGFEAGLAGALGAPLAGQVAAAVDEARVLAERDAAALERLRRDIGDPDPVLVPLLEDDVHDVEGLGRVARHLFGEDPSA